jgi:hypothetical protein
MKSRLSLPAFFNPVGIAKTFGNSPNIPWYSSESSAEPAGRLRVTMPEAMAPADMKELKSPFLASGNPI